MEVYRVPQPENAGLQVKPGDYTGLQPMPDYPQYYTQAGQPQPPGNPRRIWGLRRTTFWLILLLILVLIAAVVAGTVGGVLGSRNTSAASITTTTIAVSTSAPSSQSSSSSGLQTVSASNTPTPTITATHSGTASQPSPSSTVLRGGCPESNGQQWVSESGYNTFDIYCGTDFPSNDLINGEYLPLDNLDACLEFCALLNDKRNFTLCFGVAFSWTSGACFLKNPAIDVATMQAENVDIDSGIISGT